MSGVRASDSPATASALEPRITHSQQRPTPGSSLALVDWFTRWNNPMPLKKESANEAREPPDRPWNRRKQRSLAGYQQET
jgi:hypothetical protein